MNERGLNEFELDEPILPWLGKFSGVLLAIIAAGSVGMTLDAPEAWQTYGWVVLGLAAACVLLLSVHLHTRVVIDENGAMRRLLFRGDMALAWQQVRTAAVVQPESGLPFILLSGEAGEIALARRHLSFGRMRRGLEVRIPCTEKRRLAVEHHLGMKLPDFTR